MHAGLEPLLVGAFNNKYKWLKAACVEVAKEYLETASSELMFNCSGIATSRHLVWASDRFL